MQPLLPLLPPPPDVGLGVALGEPLGVLGDPPVGEGPPLTLSTSCVRTAGEVSSGRWVGRASAPPLPETHALRNQNEHSAL